MSHRMPLGDATRDWGTRRLVPVALGLAALLGLLGAGAAVEAERPTFRQAAAPLVGQTSTTCAVADREEQAETTITAVVSRQAPGRPGTLTAETLGANDPELTLTEQGSGERLSDPSASVVLRGEGVMATASSGAVLSAATTGPTAGLMGAPCTAPGTSHWFPGVGASESQATELILTNPDDAQAAVDLRYYGPDGVVVVPGSPGLVVPALGSRTVALGPSASPAGPLSVEVRATSGRVSAMARDVFTAAGTSVGADWHPASVAPSRSPVVGAVPEGAGDRRLVLVNPSTTRAQVSLLVLGVQGPLAPAGAATVEIGPESSLSVDLTEGLAGQSGAVQLSSDQPVTASLIAESTRAGAQPDAAVQAALPPLVRSGVSAVAGLASTDAELILSNGTDADAPLSFDLVSLDGVVLAQEDVLVAAKATATRRLDSSVPAYLVVRMPEGSAIVGGISLAQPEGPVAGLTTLGILSPDVASRAPRTVPDPGVAR